MVPDMTDKEIMASNARAFLARYHANMPQTAGYCGKDAQAYQNWRAAWMIECLEHLPTWSYKDRRLALTPDEPVR